MGLRMILAIVESSMQMSTQCEAVHCMLSNVGKRIEHQTANIVMPI